jgi:hypothetical protein
MRRLAAAYTIVASLAALTTVSCSGGDDAAPPGSLPVNDALCLDGERASQPVVEMIDPAIAAVDELYGSPQRYFEVSADAQRVSLIVAVGDGTAEQVFFCGSGGRTPPESLGDADGSTFPGDAIDIDPESIFDQIDDELDDPDIIDFATVGAGDDEVVHDATVQSDSGGILLVLLSPDGEVLAVQAQ